MLAYCPLNVDLMLHFRMAMTIEVMVVTAISMVAIMAVVAMTIKLIVMMPMAMHCDYDDDSDVCFHTLDSY